MKLFHSSVLTELNNDNVMVATSSFAATLSPDQAEVMKQSQIAHSTCESCSSQTSVLLWCGAKKEKKRKREPVPVHLQGGSHWWIKKDMGGEGEGFACSLLGYLGVSRRQKLKFIFPPHTIPITVLSERQSMPRHYSSDICCCQWGMMYACCPVDRLCATSATPEWVKPLEESN